MSKLWLRPASNHNIEQELDRVRAFYGEHRHEYVRERDPQVLADAIERASLLIVEDEAGRIVGSCAQISHCDGDYSETGAVRVIANGLGLQAMMMGIAAIGEHLFA